MKKEKLLRPEWPTNTVGFVGNKVGDRPPGGRVGDSRLVPPNNSNTDLANHVSVGNTQSSTSRRVRRRNRPEVGCLPYRPRTFTTHEINLLLN